MERQGTPRSILLAAALRLALALALGGCALTLSGPAPDRPRDQPPKCDTGKGLVALDAITGAAMGLVTIVALDEGAGTGALLPLTIGTAYIASAVSGNRQVNACREAVAAYGSEAPEPLADEEETRRARAPGRWRAPAAAPPRRGVTAQPARGRAPAVAPAASVAPAPAPAAPVPPAQPAQPAVEPPPAAAAAAPAPPATTAKGPPPRPAPPVNGPPPSPAPPSPASWVDFWRELP